MISKPTEIEYNPYYGTYINKIEAGAALHVLETNMQTTKERLLAIPETKGDYQYAEGKWTVKQLVQHLIDTEQIMSYRALRIARGDKTAMPGFDQDEYAEASMPINRTLSQLANDFESLRKTTISLLTSFSEEELSRIGRASNSPISVRALVYIMAGHEQHHLAVLKEHYGL